MRTRGRGAAIGSGYHSPIVVFLSSALMLLLPLFAAGVEGALSMIPFGPHLSVAPGFDIGSLAKLYFLLSAITGSGFTA